MGFTEAGFPPNRGIGVTETLTDAGALFLTPNTTAVYAWATIDVKDGPMVLQGSAYYNVKTPDNGAS